MSSQSRPLNLSLGTVPPPDSQAQWLEPLRLWLMLWELLLNRTLCSVMDSGNGRHAWIFSSQFSDINVTRTNSKSQLNSIYCSLFLPGPAHCHRRKTHEHFPCPEMDTCYILVVRGMALAGIRIEKEPWTVLCNLPSREVWGRLSYNFLLLGGLSEESTAPKPWIFLLYITGNYCKDYFKEDIITT